MLDFIHSGGVLELLLEDVGSKGCSPYNGVDNNHWSSLQIFSFGLFNDIGAVHLSGAFCSTKCKQGYSSPPSFALFIQNRRKKIQVSSLPKVLETL
jgi:hypothetical protein